jgi:hypothetical protein
MLRRSTGVWLAVDHRFLTQVNTSLIQGRYVDWRESRRRSGGPVHGI